MAADLRLVAKGKREVTSAVQQQGIYHVALAREDAKALGENGWPPERTERLAADVEALPPSVTTRASAKGDTELSSRQEVAARQELKSLCAKIWRCYRIEVKKLDAPSVPLSDLSGVSVVKDSTPKLLHFVTERLDKVRAIDELIRPYFKGKAASAELSEAHRRLTAIDAKQSVGLTATPAETEKLNELKGRIVDAIEDLNDVARFAFEGDALHIARYNKDLLLRARRAPKPVDEPPAA